MTASKIKSLLLVEERLLECQFFARKIKMRNPTVICYYINAFLSSARSSTFLLQKEMSRVPGFAEWWTGQQKELRQDKAAVFFTTLRNFSQKEGRVSFVGHKCRNGPKSRWSYRFLSGGDPVPSTLQKRDIAECCLDHTAKLACIVLKCTSQFPYHCCPRSALTPEGMQALALSFDDIEDILGLPRDWTDVPAIPEEIRLRILSDRMDGLDFIALNRLARWRPSKMPSSKSEPPPPKGGGFRLRLKAGSVRPAADWQLAHSRAAISRPPSRPRKCQVHRGPASPIPKIMQA